MGVHRRVGSSVIGVALLLTWLGSGGPFPGVIGIALLVYALPRLLAAFRTPSEAAANKTLSQKRAEAVKKYLVENFKIPEARFVAVGHGSANPVASNASEDGRALNRRTDIKVVLNVQ